MISISGFAALLNHFFAFVRRRYRVLLLLVLADATLLILFSALTDLILGGSDYQGDFSWSLTVILTGKSFLWRSMLLCGCISAVRGRAAFFPQRPLRSYSVALLRFAVVYYPVAYLLTFVFQYLARLLPAGNVSFLMQDYVFALLLLYPLLRLGPAIAAPLVGDTIGVKRSWRTTAGRFAAFMLPLVPLALVRELFFALTIGIPIPSAVYASFSALKTVFWFAYCAVWYVEIVDGPDPGRAARINSEGCEQGP